MSGVTWLDAHGEEICLAIRLHRFEQERAHVEALRNEIRLRLEAAVQQAAGEGRMGPVTAAAREKIVAHAMTDAGYTIDVREAGC